MKAAIVTGIVSMGAVLLDGYIAGRLDLSSVAIIVGLVIVLAPPVISAVADVLGEKEVMGESRRRARLHARRNPQRAQSQLEAGRHHDAAPSLAGISRAARKTPHAIIDVRPMAETKRMRNADEELV